MRLAYWLGGPLAAERSPESRIIYHWLLSLAHCERIHTESEREKLLFRARRCRRDSVALATAASARKSLGAPKKAAQEDGRASRERGTRKILL